MVRRGSLLSVLSIQPSPTPTPTAVTNDPGLSIPIWQFVLRLSLPVWPLVVVLVGSALFWLKRDERLRLTPQIAVGLPVSLAGVQFLSYLLVVGATESRVEVWPNGVSVIAAGIVLGATIVLGAAISQRTLEYAVAGATISIGGIAVSGASWNNPYGVHLVLPYLRYVIAVYLIVGVSLGYLTASSMDG